MVNNKKNKDKGWELEGLLIRKHWSHKVDGFVAEVTFKNKKKGKISLKINPEQAAKMLEVVKQGIINSKIEILKAIELWEPEIKES